MQLAYKEMACQALCPVQLLDKAQHFTKELTKEPGTLVIMDNMQATHTHMLSAWFMYKSHHYDKSIIHQVQNIIVKGPTHRTISLITTYTILFKNPRDMSQVSYLYNMCTPEATGSWRPPTRMLRPHLPIATWSLTCTRQLPTCQLVMNELIRTPRPRQQCLHSQVHAWHGSYRSPSPLPQPQPRQWSWWPALLQQPVKVTAHSWASLQHHHPQCCLVAIEAEEAEAWKDLVSLAQAILPKTTLQRAMTLQRHLVDISWTPGTLEMVVDGMQQRGSNLLDLSDHMVCQHSAKLLQWLLPGPPPNFASPLADSRRCWPLIYTMPMTSMELSGDKDAENPETGNKVEAEEGEKVYEKLSCKHWPSPFQDWLSNM